MRLLVPPLSVAVLCAFSTALLADRSLVELEVAKMASVGLEYDPAPLVEHGSTGLNGVLDRLLPLKPPRPKHDDITLFTLLESASSDDRARALGWLRESAEAGDFSWFEAAPVAEGSRSEKEMERILSSVLVADASLRPHCAGFKVYLETISDADSVAILTERVVQTLERNNYRLPVREHLLKLCVAAVAGSSELQQLSRLTAYFRDGKARDSRCHGQKGMNRRVARWLVELACTGEDNGLAGRGELNRLLVASLDSNFAEVVREALGACDRLSDNGLVDDTQVALQRVFEGDNEELKFQSCFSLMYIYNDTRAIEYLIQQTAASDRDRVGAAITWLGDACNSGNRPPPGLLDALEQHLSSDEVVLRLATCRTLGRYGGEGVVRLLLGSLGDCDERVVDTACYQLQWSPFARSDKAAFLDILQEAAVSHQSERVREGCLDLIASVK